MSLSTYRWQHSFQKLQFETLYLKQLKCVPLENLFRAKSEISSGLGMGTADRFICDTCLSIAVNQSKTGPPSTWFGFLCMQRVPGGVSTYLLAGLTMSAKRDDQTAISKSLKSGTLPIFTKPRSLLSVEKVARELVYRNFPVQASSATHSIA